MKLRNKKAKKADKRFEKNCPTIVTLESEMKNGSITIENLDKKLKTIPEKELAIYGKELLRNSALMTLVYSKGILRF